MHKKTFIRLLREDKINQESAHKESTTSDIIKKLLSLVRKYPKRHPYELERTTIRYSHEHY